MSRQHSTTAVALWIPIVLFIADTFEPGIQCVIDNPAVFQSRLVVRTDQPQSFTNQVQSCGGWLDCNGLHRVGFADDSGDPVQDWIG